MKASEIYVAKRDYQTKGVSVTHASIDIEGMRADQILTSPLFGLSTTRSAVVASDIDRYSVLRIRQRRTVSEERELAALKERLQECLRSGETELQRTVEAAIDITISKLGKPENIYTDELLASVEKRMEIRRQLSELVQSREGK